MSEAQSGAEDPALDRADDEDQIRRALGQLSADHRRVVVLRYFADLSTAEVANALGVREGTVKSRLSRALEQMREALSG